MILCVVVTKSRFSFSQVGAAARPDPGGQDGCTVPGDRPDRQEHAAVRGDRLVLRGGVLVVPPLLLAAHPPTRAAASRLRHLPD